MSKELPEKTCTIDKLITKPEDIQKVLDNEKRVSRRNGRYSDIGEVMEFQGRNFKITNVYEQKLGEMTDHDAQNEGYADLQGYKQHIKNIHSFTRKLPFMPWFPSKNVWVHEFEEIKDEETSTSY